MNFIKPGSYYWIVQYYYEKASDGGEGCSVLKVNLMKGGEESWK